MGTYEKVAPSNTILRTPTTISKKSKVSINDTPVSEDPPEYRSEGEMELDLGMDYRNELVRLFFDSMLDEMIEERIYDVIELPSVNISQSLRASKQFMAIPEVTEDENWQTQHELTVGRSIEVQETTLVPNGCTPNLFNWIIPPERRSGTIIFKNGNSYGGQMYKGIMDGKGVFRWSDSTTYTGSFLNGYPTGKGEMVLPDLSLYEGDVCQGYFHGNGTLRASGSGMFYTGEWKSGKRHGKGFALFGPNESYEGDWFEDMRQGIGLKKYSNGARYKGEWHKNRKKGKGSMVFENKDYYSGDWLQDLPHGYGEYTWKMFLNKTLTFPIYNMYKGSWVEGMRSGVGMLYFGTESGAKLAGTWKRNKKHGPGVIVCGNGEMVEYFPLFENDKPAHKDINKIKKLHDELIDENCTENELCNNSFTDISALINTNVPVKKLPKQILQNIILGIVFSKSTSAKFINLPDTNSTVEVSKHCNSPLYINIHCTTYNVDLTYFINEMFRRLYSEASRCNVTRNDNSVKCVRAIERETAQWPLEFNKETKLLQNMITVYLPKLRQLYTRYATIAADRKELIFEPIMVRLFLWQFLRDIHATRHIALVDFDEYMSRNPCSCFEYDLHYPFEHIYFWQFLQSLIGCAWMLRDVDDTDLLDERVIPLPDLGKGFAAELFKRFLEQAVFPNTDLERHYGYALTKYKNLVSIESVYKLYRSLGEPHTVNLLLYSTCPKPGMEVPCYAGIQPEHVEHKEGVNAAFFGDRLGYIEHSVTPIEYIIQKKDEYCISIPKPPERKYADYEQSLYTFRELGRSKITKCIQNVCPLVSKPRNLGYRLTFLEFYEILLELTIEKVDKTRQAAREEFRYRVIADMSVMSTRPVSSTFALGRGSKSVNKIKRKHETQASKNQLFK